MKNIKVFIYSYKNKNLFSALSDIISKESGMHNIKYYIYDQSNIDNGLKYIDINNVFYHHIYWDDTSSITHYRKFFLMNSSEYYLELSDKIVLTNSWDDFLIKNITEKNVISGKNKISLFYKNIFIEKKYEKTKDISLNSFVDFDLVFTKFNNAIAFFQLSTLKDVGQDIYASLLLMNKGIDIFSLPDNFYFIDDKGQDQYLPYSKYHGYNQIVKKIKETDTEKFDKFHKINLSEMKSMPYQVDDLLSGKISSSLDARSEGRYTSFYNTIEIL
jgi:hypothetical protein